MRVRVIQTTDGKYVGQVFTLPPGPPTLAGVVTATGGRFNPTRIVVQSDGRIRISNTQYTAVVEAA